MPGPGPHMLYAMGSGMALTTLSDGRFSPHHTLFYTINAFFGPDIGSFSDWLSSVLGFSASSVPDVIHHPVFYILILGLPLCLFYSWLSSFLLHKGLLDSVFGVSQFTPWSGRFWNSVFYFLDHCICCWLPESAELCGTPNWIARFPYTISLVVLVWLLYGFPCCKMIIKLERCGYLLLLVKRNEKTLWILYKIVNLHPCSFFSNDVGIS